MDSLNDEEYEHLVAALEYLEEHGPTAGRPFVDTLEGSKHPNMKELRPRPTNRDVYMRPLFAFDMTSRALVLVVGDQAGNWSTWHSKYVPLADDLFTEHQARLRKQRRDSTTTRKSPRARKGNKR